MDPRFTADILGAKEMILSAERSIDSAWETLKPLCPSSSAILKTDLPSKIVKDDLRSFLMYMAASDGVIHDSEVEFLNLLYDLEITPEDCKRSIVQDNLYTTEFEETLPKSFIVIIELEVLRSKILSTNNQDLIDALISVYEKLGGGIACCDGQVSFSEKTDLSIYIKMIKQKSSDLKKKAESRYKV